VAKNLGVIAVFCLPAIFLWWHAWDGHLGSTLACTCGDSGQQVWFIAWPAYALQHGLNPFFSGSLWAPKGVNLLSNASFPLVGMVLAPVTWIAGPIASTNIALTLAPALSAWGCWIACRRMVGWSPAAWIAGFVFGYSPFVIDNDATGHIGLALLVVPPLMMLVGRKMLAGQGDATRLGIGLGLLVVAQFMISTEILAITVVVGVIGLLSTAAWVPRLIRHSWRFAARGTVVAMCLTAIVLAVPAWIALFGPRHIVGAPWPAIQIQGNRFIDILAPGQTGIPNPLLQLGGYEGPAGPPSAYLGYAVVALAVVGALVSWRRRSTRVLSTTAVVTVVLSLGALFWTTGGAATVWLPWRALGSLPVLDAIGPQRFSALADLFIAVIVALGVDACWLRTSQWRRALASPGIWRPGKARGLVAAGCLVALSAAALIPIWAAYHAPLTTRSVSEPRWLEGIVRTGHTAGKSPVVLTYPFSMSATAFSAPMVWQSMSGISFRLAGGYAKVPGPNGRALQLGPARSAERVLAALSAEIAGPFPSGAPWQIATLRSAVSEFAVTYVAITDRGRAPSYAAELFAAVLGRAPSFSSGAWTWRVTGSAGAVGNPESAPGISTNPSRSALALRNCRTLLSHTAGQWRAVALVSDCIVAQERPGIGQR
jgi:MYXO-CTERM domain-containing protein